MRNPAWHRDEIILALDLYFDLNRSGIDSGNPKIVEVSQLLNSLPIFPDRPDEEKFRNPNGVTLKLSNFKVFDPEYSGKGMRGGSKLDRIVFEEFYNDRAKLKSIATEIKKIAGNQDLKQKIYAIEDDEQSIRDSVSEGQVLYKLHKVRERDSKIIKQKKDQVFGLTGKLACEACIFEFSDFYGDLGTGFIECHHRVPLSSFKVSTRTSLDDLSLVCSNCHRMLHRRIDSITIEQLRLLIKYERISFKSM